jgi:hypothetical protein
MGRVIRVGHRAEITACLEESERARNLSAPAQGVKEGPVTINPKALAIGPPEDRLINAWSMMFPENRFTLFGIML